MFRVLAAVLALLFSGQAQAAPAPAPAALCVANYSNAAWGLVYRGALLGSDGVLRPYDLKDFTGEAARTLLMGEDDARLATIMASPAAGAVDPAVLAEKLALVQAAAGGPYGPRRSVARDRGAFTVTCYTAAGRPVLITEEGDWQQENQSPAARELRAWLETVDPRFRSR
ncbi:hypothetical protein [Zavarzinia compransoris]|uniref:DUF1795 domain-containing protein n=1 Tax=Zavarzinia compransoris TaxID=1264899 RepID=A0A317E6F2_9PROT|nr:hypothetical protein [Zavarzinia compransoris]PWR21874.1 hypothetical protein DKG75_07780 [Zavarzinia compransoris]TDP45320.1 hypothetical protein DES42_10520 [Zavarzinia compransoris]